MKALLLAAALASSANAYAATCHTEIETKNGDTVRRFTASAYDYNQACNSAMSYCTNELRRLQSNGQHPNARCLYKGGNPNPGHPGHPGGPGYPGGPGPGPGYPGGPGPGYPYPYPGVEVVQCASYNFGYNSCYVGYAHRVEVRRFLSHRCVNGTFGLSGSHVWVNHGCAAEFNVYH